jgi:hypothetical protein
VSPSIADRRVQSIPWDPPLIERRKRNEPRVKIGSEWANGWLAFETRGQKRRLAKYPADWESLSDEALDDLCTTATEVTPPRRLVE